MPLLRQDGTSSHSDSDHHAAIDYATSSKREKKKVALSKRIRQKSRYPKGTQRTLTGERLHHGHTLGEWAMRYGCGVQQVGYTEYTAHCGQRFNEVLGLVNQDLEKLNQPTIKRESFEWINEADILAYKWAAKIEAFSQTDEVRTWDNSTDSSIDLVLTRPKKSAVSTPMYCYG
jgi:hypothetical protein